MVASGVDVADGGTGPAADAVGLQPLASYGLGKILGHGSIQMDRHDFSSLCFHRIRVHRSGLFLNYLPLYTEVKKK
jgi:hypothetical protein